MEEEEEKIVFLYNVINRKEEENKNREKVGRGRKFFTHTNIYIYKYKYIYSPLHNRAFIMINAIEIYIINILCFRFLDCVI